MLFHISVFYYLFPFLNAIEINEILHRRECEPRQRCSYIYRQGKRVDTSIDVGISYVMSSVSSSSRKRRQAADSAAAAETGTTAEAPVTTAEPQTTEEPLREEKAFAISLIDKTELTTAAGQLGESL